MSTFDPKRMSTRDSAMRAAAHFIWLLILWAAPVDFARAQSGGPLEYARGDRALIRSQLQLSIACAERAALILEGGGDAETLGGAKALTFQSYRLLRVAIAGVQELRSDAAERPATSRILELVTKSIAQAMEHNRQAQHEIVESITWTEGRESRVPTAIGALRQAVRLARLAANVL